MNTLLLNIHKTCLLRKTFELLIVVLISFFVSDLLKSLYKDFLILSSSHALAGILVSNALHIKCKPQLPLLNNGDCSNFSLSSLIFSKTL